jgi:hypothetical protein
MKCLKIRWKDPEQGEIITLLGITSSQDEKFIYFKTAKRNYTINKSLILSIVDTEEEFYDSESNSTGNEKSQTDRGVEK